MLQSSDFFLVDLLTSELYLAFGKAINQFISRTEHFRGSLKGQ